MEGNICFGFILIGFRVDGKREIFERVMIEILGVC